MNGSNAIRLTLDTLWQQGRRYEAARDFSSARQQYERLLAMHGAHVPARLRMSRFEQAAGNYRAAREHALAAADAVRLGASYRHIAYVTMRLLDFAEENEVASVVLSCDWNDPDVRSQASVLAQHLALCGRYHDCLRLIAAVAGDGPQARLALIRGDALRALGHLDQASIEYETAVALQPDFVDAHWALAKSSDAGQAGRIARLRALRSRMTAASEERAHVCYALFHELDRAGDHDAAWDSLTEGAAIIRALVNHDAVREDIHLRRCLVQFSGKISTKQFPSRQQPSPIFVVGLPRTGTTLLDRILGNHGWISSTGERNDFGAAVSQVCDRFFRSLVDDPMPDGMSDADWQQVGHLYMERLRRHASATAYAIDKNPANLFNIPLILRALPEAKILCLRRDPMDAAFSNLKELFQGGAYAYSYDFTGLAQRIRGADSWMKQWAAAAPDAVRIVAYEDLVNTPQATVAEVLEFLGAPWLEGLEDLVRNEAPVATASAVQVRQPIHARAVGAWWRYSQQLEPLRLQLLSAP